MGATAGLIYHRQRRLVPLIVSHFIVNAGLVVPPLFFATG